MPTMSPLLAVLLAAWLTASAGCAVLPIALKRPMPPTDVALDGMAEAQDFLADSSTHYERTFAPATDRRPVAAHGATQAAYQRWVNDEVRELPDVSETIAIGGEDT